MAGVGIRSQVEGPLTKFVDFVPDEDKSKRYMSFELGYVGGALKVNCTAEHIEVIKKTEPGTNIKAVVMITCKGKESRFECEQLKAG